MLIKICGITNKNDAKNAIELGANAIGFIFYEKSPRHISPEQAEEIAFFCPPFVQLVGVFVNQSQSFILKTKKKCCLDIIQLHGNEDEKFCKELNQKIIKAIHIKSLEDTHKISHYQGYVNGILLDTKTKKWGGSGQTFDWGIAKQAKQYSIPIILSGGINESNIKQAILIVQPHAIDACSSIESKPGTKNYNKMATLIKYAKEN